MSFTTIISKELGSCTQKSVTYVPYAEEQAITELACVDL